MPTEPGETVLRGADEADAEAVARLYLETRAASEPAMPPLAHDAEEVRAWIGRRVAGSGTASETWVAEQGKRLVGFTTFTDTWLDDLYVHPAHQGQGLGVALLDLVKSRLPRGFSLWVFASNEVAREFYRRQGLVELERTDGSANDEHASDVRLAWPGEDPLAYLRGRIDEVDDDLAVLLSRRVALTAAVQDKKAAEGAYAGERGRDAAREAEIIERMSRHAPGLGRERIARVMHTVIEESLAAWEDTPRD